MPIRVLIVGAGASGLCAALEASAHGAEVTIVEREPSWGGNGANSTGLIRGSETWLQEKLGIEDSYIKEFEEDWENSGHLCNPLLVARLARNSRSAYSWLRKVGVRIKDDGMAFMPRTGAILPDGSGLVGPLHRACSKNGVEFVYGTKMVRFLRREASVSGIEAINQQGEKVLLKDFNAVVSCTGGVWGPRELLEPRLKPVYGGLIFSWGLPTGGKGDGIRAIEEIGGTTVDMDNLLTNASVFLDENLNIVGGASSSLRHAAGAIMVNQGLARFTNEDLTYNILADKVAAELQRRKERWVWLVWDSSSLGRVPQLLKYEENFSEFGLLVGSSLAELEKKMRKTSSRLRRTIERYNRSFHGRTGVEPAFGRPIHEIRPLERPPFYAFRAGITCSSLRGGAAITPQAQVLDGRGNPITGLFAAGEDAGGFFGRGYLTGTSLEHSVVFGRIAGENAASGDLHAAERQEKPVE